MSSIFVGIIILTYISTLDSEIITCTDPSGCIWDCSGNGDCHNNTYNCTSTASSCYLQCKSCDSIHIFSSSEMFNIICTDGEGCSNMDIIALTNTSHIKLHCDSSIGCNTINLECPLEIPSNCHCIDNGQNICSNEVNGNFVAHTNKPTISPIQTPSYYPTISPVTTTTKVIIINNSRTIHIYAHQPSTTHDDGTYTLIILSTVIIMTVIGIPALMMIYTKRKSKQTEIDVNQIINVSTKKSVSRGNISQCMEADNVEIAGVEVDINDNDNGEEIDTKTVPIEAIITNDIVVVEENEENEENEESQKNEDKMDLPGHTAANILVEVTKSDSKPGDDDFVMVDSENDEESEENHDIIYIPENKTQNELVQVTKSDSDATD